MRTISRQHATLLSEEGWLSQIPNALRGEVLNACLCYDLDTGEAITHGGEGVIWYHFWNSQRLFDNRA